MPEVTHLSLVPPPEPWDEAFAGFAIRLEADGRSPRTVTSYLRDLRTLVAALGASCSRPSDVTPERLTEALASPAVTARADGEPRASATVDRLKAATISFFAWAEETGRVGRSPARSVRLQHLPRRSPAFLTEAEKRRLLKELAGRVAPRDQRDRVIVELFLGTGLRLQELVELDIDDVDLETKHLRIRRSKGGAPQTKFLATGLRRLLRAHMKDRVKDGTAATTALFLSTRGSRLSARQVDQRVRYWLRKAGIRKTLGPHGLRHSFATHLYSRTANLLMVQKALGHRSLASTQVYTHLVDAELEDALEAL